MNNKNLEAGSTTAPEPTALKGTYVPVPGWKVVVFDELNPDGEECTSFMIDDKRAETFHREQWVKNHLEPVFRFVPAGAAAPAQGLVQRFRDLAAGKITGEIPVFEYSFAADRIQELENMVEQMKASLAAVRPGSGLTHAVQHEDTGALIDAAEEHAKAYDDDDRECIKTDVMNGFYAGSAWRAANPLPAAGQKLDETACIVDILGRPCLQGSPSCINAEHFEESSMPSSGNELPHTSSVASAHQELAMDMYNEQRADLDQLPPLERLRYFCSLAMKGQDWLDSEKFFDDVAAEFAAQAEKGKIPESEADFQDLLRQVKERLGVGNSMTIQGIARRV